MVGGGIKTNTLFSISHQYILISIKMNNFIDIYIIGNSYIHLITNTGKFELVVNMETIDGHDIYAAYKVLKLGNAAS